MPDFPDVNDVYLPAYLDEQEKIDRENEEEDERGEQDAGATED